MKRKQYAKRILTVLLAVLCTWTLCACGGNGGETENTTDAGVELKKPELAVDADLASFSYDADTGIYTDTTTGNTYRMASISYEPVTLAAGYGSYDGKTLYRLDGCDVKDYLTPEYDNVGDVLVGTAISLPSLSELHFTSAAICDQKEIVISVGTIADEAVLQQLVTLLQTAPEMETPRTVTQSYKLKLISTELPMLYYTVTYLESGDGKVGVSDRGTGRMVEIGDLLAAYIN